MNKWVNVETGETRQRKRKQFVIKYETIWRAVIQSQFFTDKERVVLDNLSMFLAYNNSIASKDGPMNPSQMARSLGMDESNFRRVFKGLRSKNAIGKFNSGERDTYYLNPELYCKGEDKPWLVELFRHDSKRMENEGLTLFSFGRRVTTLGK